MSIEFKNLQIALPEQVENALEANTSAKQLYEVLIALDGKAALARHKENNMRISMLQSGIKQWLEQVNDLNASWDIDFLIQTLSMHIDLVMAADIGDEWGFYESEWFDYIREETNSDTSHFVEYSPIKISEKFGAINRMHVSFIDQPGLKQQVFFEQPFIKRSQDPLSIKFAEEYYRYCCNPTDYPGSKVSHENMWSQEWFPITPEVCKHIEKKLECDFTQLAIYPFFNQSYGYYLPTHWLLCQMLMMNATATVPPYLSTGHLWNPQEMSKQVQYYTQFLIKNSNDIQPNQSWLCNLLQGIVTILKQKNGRLADIEITTDDLLPIIRDKNIRPFELYEHLLREQLFFVTNITEGENIGFKLTNMGIMFLYMCCPVL